MKIEACKAVLRLTQGRERFNILILVQNEDRPAADPLIFRLEEDSLLHFQVNDVCIAQNAYSELLNTLTKSLVGAGHNPGLFSQAEFTVCVMEGNVVFKHNKYMLTRAVLAVGEMVPRRLR